MDNSDVTTRTYDNANQLTVEQRIGSSSSFHVLNQTRNRQGGNTMWHGLGVQELVILAILFALLLSPCVGGIIVIIVYLIMRHK